MPFHIPAHGSLACRTGRGAGRCQHVRRIKIQAKENDISPSLIICPAKNALIAKNPQRRFFTYAAHITIKIDHDDKKNGSGRIAASVLLLGMIGISDILQYDVSHRIGICSFKAVFVQVGCAPAVG